MTKRTFITGGAGFIGREVVRQLLEQGHAVRIFDVEAPKQHDHLPHSVTGDVRDREALVRAMTEFNPTHVLHLASDIDVNIQHLSEFTTTLTGTNNVLWALSKCIELERFVHVSTQFVVKPGVVSRSETHFDPYTIYGEAKAETERAVWGADISVPWYILRPSIIWGPHHPSFAQHIFKHIANRTYLHPSSRAGIIRTFGYVSNVAHQMMIFLEIDPTLTQRRMYYLGDSNMEYGLWADAFARELTGKKARRIPLPLLKLMGRGGDFIKKAKFPSPIDSGRVFRMSTASAIDLTPTLALTAPLPTSFEQGVAETVAWLKEADPKMFGPR